jgi:prevent-host-death family protein
MSNTITATELARKLADYLNRVSYRGETFVVHRGGRPVAELRPAPRGILGKDFLARYRTLPHLTPDEAVSMGDDIDQARTDLAHDPLANPWES